MEKNYKYGLLSGTTLILFNDTEHRANPLNTEFLEDVKIQIKDNGCLEITARRIIFDFYSFSDGRIFEKYWQRQPHPKEIHEGKRWWWSRKKERFVNAKNGSVRTTETVNVHYVLTIYKIEIFD